MREEYRQVIDDVLLEMNARALEFAEKLQLPLIQEDGINLPRLQQSTFGQNLAIIAEFAEKGGLETQQQTQQAIQDVIKFIFDNPYMVDRVPPREFFQNAQLGKLINATYAHMNLTDLITPTDAHNLLEVSRQTIYNFISQGKLTPVIISRRIMLIRSQIEEMKKFREE